MSLDALRGLADPTRRRILERLSRGGLAVGEIAADLPISRPAVSKHLRVLRELGLVVETPEGRTRIYELVAQPFGEMAAWIEMLAEAEAARRDVAGVARPEEAGPAAAEPSPRAATSRARASERKAGDEDRWRSW